MTKNSWTSYYLKKKTQLSYPAEAVIRIFNGKYPNLNFQYKKNDKILDIGFGDGRHLFFFKSINLDVYGIEISKLILKKIKTKKFNLKKGNCHNIPFNNYFFDIIFAWNSCYYMGKNKKNFDLKKNIFEMHSKLKRNGFIILSFPTKNCFIFSKSISIKKKYRIIKNDYFKMRNGEIMRFFKNKKEIKDEFKSLFLNFSFKTISIDCFGIKYNWIVMIAQKK